MRVLFRGRFEYEHSLHAEGTHEFRRDRCDINRRVEEVQAQVEGLSVSSWGVEERPSSVERQIDTLLAFFQGESMSLQRGHDAVFERVDELGRLVDELTIKFRECFEKDTSDVTPQQDSSDLYKQVIHSGNVANHNYDCIREEFDEMMLAVEELRKGNHDGGSHE